MPEEKYFAALDELSVFDSAEAHIAEAEDEDRNEEEEQEEQEQEEEEAQDDMFN